jgi:hypothetical protein
VPIYAVAAWRRRGRGAAAARARGARGGGAAGGARAYGPDAMRAAVPRPRRPHCEQQRFEFHLLPRGSWMGMFPLIMIFLVVRGSSATSSSGCVGESSDSDECATANAAAVPAAAGPRRREHSTINSHDSLQYSVFMGMQYYGPPEPMSTYHTIAQAAKKLAPAPFFISVCCDHNDAGGGAENRTGDPGDGGWITPICRRNDTEGAAVRRGISILRDAGVHVLHYTHTRLGCAWCHACCARLM